MSTSDAAASAAQALVNGRADVTISAAGELPDDAPETTFDRLSVERRVLGAINDDQHSERLGARNTLPALADFLLTDPNTTNPPEPNDRLDIEGLDLADQVQLVLDKLDALIDAGLVERDGDVDDPAHTYHLTEAGVTELQS